MNYALLTAGGVGSRMKMDIPKQFYCVKGKPVIVYTMERFEQHPDIDGICVACLDGWQDRLKAMADEFHITKLKWIVKGGENGQASITAGVMELKKHIQPEDLVLISDGNRPFVSKKIIDDSLKTCRRYGSACAHFPAIEAVFVIGEEYASISKENLHSKELLDRTRLIKAQTPTTLSMEKLLWAYGEAAKRGITNSVGTCTLLTELGETVYFSESSPTNIKVTTPDDLILMESILERWENE